jgi:hypothetical protein
MATLNAHTPGEAGISVAVQQFFEGKKGIKKPPSEYFNQFYIAAVSWESYLADTVNGWPIITSSSAATSTMAMPSPPGRARWT